MSASLSGLTIGSLSLTPEFSSGVSSYTATTSNATNKVTATPEDENAVITIVNGETEIANGSSASWQTGENTLTITVINGATKKTYTVIVTKE